MRKRKSHKLAWIRGVDDVEECSVECVRTIIGLGERTKKWMSGGE